MNAVELKRWLGNHWSIGQAATMAILLEASASKAGNVSPSVPFSNMDYTDFLASAVAIGPVFDQAATLSVGQLIWQSVDATQRCCGLNTNLGTLLLLAPLAKAHARISKEQPRVSLSARVGTVLEDLSEQDTQLVYDAILLAKPGGLGRAAEHDVHAAPPADLRQAMQQSAQVDAVARQYTNDFKDILDKLLVWLRRGLQRGVTISQLVCEVQLRWLAREPDGLIVRKCGAEIAREAQQLAEWALDELLETGQSGLRWQALDSFLRSDGHRRNPGTTADLIAAAIFALLLDQSLPSETSDTQA